MSAAHAKKSIEFVRVIKDFFYAIWLPYLYAQVYFLGKENIRRLEEKEIILKNCKYRFRGKDPAARQ